MSCFFLNWCSPFRSWAVLITMDNLSQLALRTQTIFGGIHFIFFLISWPFVIGFLKDYHDKDRLTFNCIPKPDDFTRQRCYDNYTSAMSLLPLHLTPLDFACTAYGGLGMIWVSFILMGAVILRWIQRERGEQGKRKHSKTFVLTFIAHVCVQLVFLGVMMGLFCTYQGLHFPAEYKCHQTNMMLTSLNQRPVNFTCNDLLYNEKSNLNIAIIGIMAFSTVCCLLALIHLVVKRKAFVEQLLRNIFETEDGNAAGLNLVGESRARCWDARWVLKYQVWPSIDLGYRDPYYRGTDCQSYSLLRSHQASQQTNSGRVRDQPGLPVPGASLIWDSWMWICM